MIHVAGVKHVTMILPQSVTDTTVTGLVDTIGFRSLAIAVVQDTAAAASNNPAVLKLDETDDLTNYTDVAGSVGDTDWTIPAVDTTVANPYIFNLDLRGHSRYIRVTIESDGAATLTYAHAILARPEHTPVTAAEVGGNYVLDL